MSNSNYSNSLSKSNQTAQSNYPDWKVSQFKNNLQSNNHENYSELRKIGEFQLHLKSQKNELKIGKINDMYNPDRCLIDKEANSKSFKLIEKKFDDKLTKFSGSLMAEQTSKYLLFKTDLTTNTIEIFPADSWFMFKKDINYKTINLEEAEDKMKLKSHIVDSLKNKGKDTINISSKDKKGKERKDSENNISLGKFKNKKPFDEEEEEDNKCFKKNIKEKQEDIEEKDDTDLELKEIPSDLEEDFFGKKKENEKIDLFGDNEEDDDDEAVDDSSSMFQKSKENSEVEDDLSELERKFNEQNARGKLLS